MSFLLTFTTDGGRVYRSTDRGPYPMYPVEAELLLAQLRASAKVGDWWSPYAQTMADDLAACIAETRKQEAA